MDPRVSDLVKRLDWMVGRLAPRGGAHWAQRFSEASRLMRAQDARGLYVCLQAFGGMGSVLDHAWDEEMNQAIAEVWSLANELRREHEFENRSSQ